ncbi:Meiotic sister-chromatid recombination protein 6, mitochondrial [Nakaseomyces bracarensis]|uniref:Meiotic sister-chromatid recombination protein 6, mitochondrial n=1 Tax=Nakaseomyces bracarensis TaxID=273131 RepID=A0ABR4NW41_9SACH
MLRFKRVSINQRCLLSLQSTSRNFTSSVILSATDNEMSSGKSKRFPLDELNKGYSKRLHEVKVNDVSLNDLYSDFKKELSELKQERNIRFDTNNASYRLNEFVTSLLRTITDVKNETNLDPYVVLDQLTSYNLINGSHYGLVLRYYLLVQRAPKEVISLWVKYLESNQSGNQLLMAFTTIAFLKLPDNNKPDYKILEQILQTETLQTEIPFGRVMTLMEQIPELNNDKLLRSNLGFMYNDYIKQNPEWFISQIQASHTRRRLQSQYKMYVGFQPEDIKRIDILKTFMDRFMEVENNPTDAIEVFNQFKDKFTGDDLFQLHLKVLEIVSKIQGRSKIQKLQRILAVWNSFMKPTLEKDNKDIGKVSLAFATLINALDNSGNVDELQKIWDNEVPVNIKNQQSVFEAFLLAMIRRTQINYSQIQEKLATAKIKNIESTKLLEVISIRILKENPIDRKPFDEFATTNNLAVKSSDPSLLAIRTYADYLYNKTDPNHTFLIASDVRSKILKVKPKINNVDWKHDLDLALKKFIDIVPSIEPVRDLYEQNGTYQLNFFILDSIMAAEFKKSDGSVEQAEKIFEDLLKLDNKKLSAPMKVNVFKLLDSMVKGISSTIGRTHDTSLFSSLDKYLDMVRGLNVKMSSKWVEYIMSTIRRIVRTEKPGKVDPEVIAFIDNFFTRLPEIDPTFSYKLRENDTAMLKRIGCKTMST